MTVLVWVSVSGVGVGEASGVSGSGVGVGGSGVGVWFWRGLVLACLWFWRGSLVLGVGLVALLPGGLEDCVLRWGVPEYLCSG